MAGAVVVQFSTEADGADTAEWFYCAGVDPSYGAMLVGPGVAGLEQALAAKDMGDDPDGTIGERIVP